MGPSKGNKRIVDPSTSWPESRPILNDCYKICCTLFDEDVRNFRPIFNGCQRHVCVVTGRCTTSCSGVHSSCQHIFNNKPIIREESAEDCLETTSEYKYGYRPDLLRRESESTEPWDVCRPSTTSITNKFTALLVMILMMMLGVVMIIQAVYRGELKDTFLMKIMLVKNVHGVAGCICLMTTEYEDSDDSPYTDVGYYSCC
ncbi:hypothetical protein E2320_022680 [Naja naja]|nr:hypothetical protein E2320_022680 [Naja naja]